MRILTPKTQSFIENFLPLLLLYNKTFTMEDIKQSRSLTCETSLTQTQRPCSVTPLKNYSSSYSISAIKSSEIKYFTFDEMVRSDVAKAHKIQNQPTDKEIIEHIIRVMEQLDKIRSKFGKPIIITSGYRCPELNKLVAGSPTSAHQIGYAADIKCDSNTELFNLIKTMMQENEIEVDQLIWEHGTAECPAWIHVSFDSERKRHQIIYNI